MKTIKTYLPVFPGFYNTIFEPSYEEIEIQHWEDETGRELSYDDIDWDYSEYTARISEGATSAIEHELNSRGYKMKIVMEALISPQYYNYSNDTINVVVSISEGALKGIKKVILNNWDDFRGYIRERYTSCSGFMSFYSNDPVDWIGEYWDDMEKNDHIFGAILGFICEIEDIDQDTIYYACDGVGYMYGTPKELES